ncbi:hypothetical protein NFI00_000183 [Salmonella enterica]|nr:hypothetical protein [Salmonella enterica subsp. enterica serovar Minnesota]EJI5696480.1 hypothetical protein [Salmonella enterica]
MGIRLEIANKNTGPVTVNVYRGDQELDRSNLPPSIGQVANTTDNPIVYNDNNVVQGKTYYYVFETVGPKDRAFSRNFKIQALETRGPGDNDLKIGNRNLGYYGNLSAGAIIDAATLCSAVGLTGVTPNTFTYWYKFARKGKVLFVPNAHVARSGMSFNKLKTLGLLDGKTITVGAFKYKVRLMTGWDDTKPLDSNMVVGTNYSMEDYLDNSCEFNDLMYSLVKWTPNGQKLPGLFQQTVTAVTSNTLVLCKDNDGTKFVRRTMAADTRAAIATIALDNTPDTVNGSYSFLPVLELIEG